MSFEMVGEGHFWVLVEEILKDYKVLPPGTIKGIDGAVAKFIVFIEVEDTVFELYNASKQFGKTAKIARIHDIPFIAITPIPKNVDEAALIVSYFFWYLTEILGIKQKEVWFLGIKKNLFVIRIKLEEDKWVNWLKLNVKEYKISIKGKRREDIKAIFNVKIKTILSEMLSF